MDQDEIRKYERLESIKDKFEAYPPFWYFIGNAANYIANAKNLGLSDSEKTERREKALEYFEKFERLNEFSILREDQLAASCCLEHIDILLSMRNPDTDATVKNEIKDLLSTAVCMSGKSNDVLELCAITYLRISEPDEAAQILKILVNEDYNRIINAQILSSIYVHQRERSEYKLLATRVDADYLFPMPQDDEDLETLEKEFGSKQKEVLKAKYKAVLMEYLDKYSIEWNKITSVFDISADYPDSFFLDTDKARSERKMQVRRIYADSSKKEYYQRRMAESYYELNVLSILNEMCIRVFESNAFSNYALQQQVEEQIKLKISENRDDMNQLQSAMSDGNFPMTGYFLSQTIGIRDIVGKAFDLIIDYAIERVDAANINDITFLEGDLRAFCTANGLSAPEIAINRGNRNIEMFSNETEPFDAKLFGRQTVVAKKNAEFMSEMVAFVKEKVNAIDLKNNDTSIYFSDSNEFNGYFCNVAFQEHPDVKSHALMILYDKTERKYDLVFTTDGIVSVVKNRVRNITPYNEIKLKGDSLVLYQNWGVLTKDYRVTSLDINVLYDLIRQLGSKFVRSFDDKTEYIEGAVTAAVLNDWFRKQPESLRANVQKVYARPTSEIMKSYGYHCEEEIDQDKNLLQFYYDKTTRDILGLRMVRFDNIDVNFQAILEEKDGIITLK